MWGLTMVERAGAHPCVGWGGEERVNVLGLRRGVEGGKETVSVFGRSCLAILAGDLSAQFETDALRMVCREGSGRPRYIAGSEPSGAGGSDLILARAGSVRTSPGAKPPRVSMMREGQ